MNRSTLAASLVVASLMVAASSCAASGDSAAPPPPNNPPPTTVPVDDREPDPVNNPDAQADGGGCPSTGSWASLVPGPGQAGFDQALAAKVARYDRYHEALGIYATGLSGNLTVNTDTATRAKLADLLATPWNADDTDPTDDLMQYEGVDAKTFVTAFGFATGMYAGSELGADAFRYAVLRDRGGSCTELARARKVLQVGLEALHVVVAITGTPGSIARAIARKDLAGDGQSPVLPILDGSGNPNPAEKTNGTWRADNSVGGKYPNLVWVDSCSRDMLFGWTFAMAAAWEVIKDDASIDAALKTQLKADAKAVLDGLMIVRANGKDLELWDPEGRRTFHGNLHETSVDRQYILKNGPAALMALGEVAGLVSVVDDPIANTYLTSLISDRDLPQAINDSMQVVALGGEDSNHSSFNMLFMTAWMANRYIADGAARAELRDPVERLLYAPSFGAKPQEWKQSFFDFIVSISAGGAWKGAPASVTSIDNVALGRGLETLGQFADAPYYSVPKINCDANEVAAQQCVLNDGVTSVQLTTASYGLVANKPVPMAYRPPSNFFWRSNPFLVNSQGDGSNDVLPGSDIRVAYWMGRYVRIN